MSLERPGQGTGTAGTARNPAKPKSHPDSFNSHFFTFSPSFLGSFFPLNKTGAAPRTVPVSASISVYLYIYIFLFFNLLCLGDISPPGVSVF